MVPITNLNIPIWPTNYYTPSVHRIFQLAANIYDATTNRSTTVYPYLPTVFRPVFGNRLDVKPPQVSIIGYEEVTNASVLAQGVLDLADSSDRQKLLKLPGNQYMVYNIPLVIGAKKGFPNFNEFAMQTLVQVTRKLQFTRKHGHEHPDQRNRPDVPRRHFQCPRRRGLEFLRDQFLPRLAIVRVARH